MRRLLFLAVAVCFAAPAALAHDTPYAWTVGRANVMLPDAATIMLPADIRQSLEAELTPLIERLRLLEMTAQQDPGAWLAVGTYANYSTRLRLARERVRKGLSIDSARCAGTGQAVKRKRFKHFRCAATSYVLEVPTVELRDGATGTLPEVVEGPIRRFGPYDAVFTAHLTGQATVLAKRVA